MAVALEPLKMEVAAASCTIKRRENWSIASGLYMTLVRMNLMDLICITGLNRFAAISEFLLLSIHAILKEEIIFQAPAAKGFKLVLQRASAGSYDQIIQMIITDPETVSLMTDFGKNGLYDLLKYMLSSLLGIPFVLNNRKAKKKNHYLMQQNDDLLKRLESALMSAHLPVKHQGYSTVMMLGRTPIIKFDETTLSYLETEIVSPDTEVIPVQKA